MSPFIEAGSAVAISTVAALRAAGCVFAEDEARLLIESAGSPAELDDMVARRVNGLPLEYIVGWAEFCGRRIAVRPGVFVPRRRTEIMVHEATDLLPPHATVVDLGCGSGAVGACLMAVADIVLYAVDVDPAAVACARLNLVPTVLLGDLYRPLPSRLRGGVDVIVANTPYVPTGAIDLMPPEARLHEHRVALDGGTDGLDVMHRVVAGAPSWLRPGGHLLIEASEVQAQTVADTMVHHGLAARVAHDEDIDGTVVIGRYGAVVSRGRR